VVGSAAACVFPEVWADYLPLDGHVVHPSFLAFEGVELAASAERVVDLITVFAAC
jgi:hypothetical protein